MHEYFSYGRAGDKFSSSPLCEPMGTFSIDLSGTPFSLVPDTKWAWVGNYTRGNVIDGHATVKNQSNASKSFFRMTRNPFANSTDLDVTAR